MPRRILWTPAADATIIRMRAAGATWDTIAAAAGYSRWSVILRGRRIGAELTPAVVVNEPAPDPERDPFPAGHTLTWGVIIAGTLLAGTAYPHPVCA